MQEFTSHQEKHGMKTNQHSILHFHAIASSTALNHLIDALDNLADATISKNSFVNTQAATMKSQQLILAKLITTIAKLQTHIESFVKKSSNQNKSMGALSNKMGTVGVMDTALKNYSSKIWTIERMDTKTMWHEQTPWMDHRTTKDGIPEGAYQQGNIAHLKWMKHISYMNCLTLADLTWKACLGDYELEGANDENELKMAPIFNIYEADDDIKNDDDNFFDEVSWSSPPNHFQCKKWSMEWKSATLYDSNANKIVKQAAKEKRVVKKSNFLSYLAMVINDTMPVPEKPQTWPPQ